MPVKFRFPIRRALAGLFAAIAFTDGAAADDGQRASRVPLLPRYQQECAACHVAYPPGMLPAASWQRIVNNGQHHFGTDASLEPAAASELSAWLAANAGTYKRVREEPPEDRITRSSWFIRKHHEVPGATWKLPAVKNAGHCNACHTQAEQGDFNERYVRIPR